MAKNKSKGSASEETAEAAASTSANGAILMETMEDGFEIPSARMGVSQFDTLVNQVLAQEPGKSGKFPVNVLFKQVLATDKDQAEKDLMKCYTRAKQFKQAAKRLKANITVAVRKTGIDTATNQPIHAVLAQKNAE